jgi:hypothetical protein
MASWLTSSVTDGKTTYPVSNLQMVLAVYPFIFGPNFEFTPYCLQHLHSHTSLSRAGFQAQGFYLQFKNAYDAKANGYRSAIVEVAKKNWL